MPEEMEKAKTNSIISSYKIKQIISKIRQLFKYDMTLKEVILKNPNILFKEADNKTIELKYIRFEDAEKKLWVKKTEIIYENSYNYENTTIVEYKDWNDILEL